MIIAKVANLFPHALCFVTNIFRIQIYKFIIIKTKNILLFHVLKKNETLQLVIQTGQLENSRFFLVSGAYLFSLFINC